MKVVRFFITIALANLIVVVLSLFVLPVIGIVSPDKRCIVTVKGIKFDVTYFRQIHPGGDVFECGTDMTKVFYTQHNDRTLRKMEEYRLSR